MFINTKIYSPYSVLSMHNNKVIRLALLIESYQSMLIMTTSSLNCNFLPSADMTFCLTMCNLLKRCNSRNYHIKFGTLRNAVRSIKKKKAIFTFFFTFERVRRSVMFNHAYDDIWYLIFRHFFKHESSKLRYIMYVIIII